MHHKTKDIWNKLAAWWDDACQDGDLYHRTFLFPTILKWAAATKGMRILDIGCGNGSLARLLAKQGASVVATDFSEVFIEKAKQRSEGLNIDYRIIDATNEKELKILFALGKFDRVISSMVLHDMPTIMPLTSSLSQLLAPNGVFIFTVPHPCFNSGLVEIEQLKKFMEQGLLVMSNQYINPIAFEMLSKPGQPVKQISFHRSLNELFNEMFNAGLIMSGFVEPIAKEGELPKDYLWAKLSEIPPAIICRWEIKGK